MINTPENDTHAPMSARHALEWAISFLNECGGGHDYKVADALARILEVLPDPELLTIAATDPGQLSLAHDNALLRLADALEDPNA